LDPVRPELHDGELLDPLLGCIEKAKCDGQFIVAAECYPSNVRSTAHGLSAAAGKVGAFLPTLIYNYVSPRTRFWLAGPLGFVGALLTFVFLPNSTGLDLDEQDKYWAYVMEGRAGDYHGVAVHPEHLSRWERWTGRGKAYVREERRLEPKA
jgi:hypothetical protein